jgi:nitrogen regulatory protein PII-like uncharacterized protein
VLLYHPTQKTFNDFDQIYEYILHGENGTTYKIETDKELREGQVIILHDISDYAIVVTKIWEEDGAKHFAHDTAEQIVVRGRFAVQKKEEE